MGRLMQTVFSKFLPRTKELEKLRKLPSQPRRVVSPKRKLNAWSARQRSLLKRTKRSRRGLMPETVFESYLYNLKNTLDDDEKADNISAEDKKELQDIVDETLDWMDENPEAEKEDYDGKQKEVENIANPIMRNFY